MKPSSANAFDSEPKEKMNLSYSLSDIDENEMNREMLDDLDIDVDSDNVYDRFHEMNAG
jgi:hypothetical protein